MARSIHLSKRKCGVRPQNIWSASASATAPAAILIYPSSAAVYGVVKQAPIGESSPIAPVSPYGLHKAMAEELCSTQSKHFGLRCAIVRFFSVYGPGSRKQLLWDLAQKIEASPAAI